MKQWQVFPLSISRKYSLFEIRYVQIVMVEKPFFLENQMTSQSGSCKSLSLLKRLVNGLMRRKVFRMEGVRMLWITFSTKLETKTTRCQILQDLFLFGTLNIALVCNIEKQQFSIHFFWTTQYITLPSISVGVYSSTDWPPLTKGQNSILNWVLKLSYKPKNKKVIKTV